MKDNNEANFYIDGQHYDFMMKSRNLHHNRVKFFLKQTKKFGGPVLELACGTGLITIPIAKEGMSVVGLDFSDLMLEHARNKSKEQNLEIDWIKEDMMNFSLNKKFSSIIMPGLAMNWILDNKNIEKCLLCVKNHLNNEGRFIFDVFNPHLGVLLRDPSIKYPEYEYPNPNGEGIVEVSGTHNYDKKSQVSDVKTYYFIENEEFVKKIKLRMLFPQELDALLYYNGFSIDYKYGSYNEQPFTSDSSNQIVVCHKV